MGKVMWVLLFAIACALGYWCWFALRKYREKKQAEEARFAGFMAQTVSSSFGQGAEDAAAVAQQKLLFESAAKAGEAGEPALSIQLYARLITRYPESRMLEQAKTAAAEQKKKIAKAPPPAQPSA